MPGRSRPDTPASAARNKEDKKMRQLNVRLGILVALFVLFAASPAHANAFLPIVMVSWFGMFVALVPIVLIEWTIVAQITGFSGLALLAVATDARR